MSHTCWKYMFLRRAWSLASSLASAYCPDTAAPVKCHKMYYTLCGEKTWRRLDLSDQLIGLPRVSVELSHAQRQHAADSVVSSPATPGPYQGAKQGLTHLMAKALTKPAMRSVPCTPGPLEFYHSCMHTPLSYQKLVRPRNCQCMHTPLSYQKLVRPRNCQCRDNAKIKGQTCLNPRNLACTLVPGFEAGCAGL